MIRLHCYCTAKTVHSVHALEKNSITTCLKFAYFSGSFGLLISYKAALSSPPLSDAQQLFQKSPNEYFL